jgi:hypothetical protein
MKTFKHSGDMGDIIYSLAAIKSMGGGSLLLDTSGGEDEFWCKKQCIDGKTKFNKITFDFIKPVIESQDYITGCYEFNKNDKVDYNLNGFRSKFSDPNSRSKTKNLLDLHMEYLGLPEWDDNTPWLKPTETKKLDRKIIVCRSPRMQSNFPWFQSNKFVIRDQAVFMGLDKEHELFEWTFDIKIPHIKVKDALEMINYISGCDTFIGNSTFALSLAIGLGNIRIIQEVMPQFPTTVFSKKVNMQYI